jgi:hypothetical protein
MFHPGIINDKRPCKSNRPKERAKIVDDFDHCVIKRTIHGLYSWKIAPTVSIIHKEIKDSTRISNLSTFVNTCFIQVHDIIPCFPKRFGLSQIIIPIIDNRHLVVQNSSIFTYFFISISQINES